MPFEQRVRDAMVPEPLSLDASASAQEAGEALERPGLGHHRVANAVAHG